MAFAIGGAGALLKAFIPSFPRLISYRQGTIGRAVPARAAALSPEAEAALAPLGLLPDGPVDPEAAPRARLAPDVAARNFVRWAQALELDGDYATRSIYALYCEFSEVDGRPPLRDARFLPALAETEGISTVAQGKDKSRRGWRWTIAPAKPVEVVAEAIADVWSHVSAPAPDRAAKTASSKPDPAPVPQGAAPLIAAAGTVEAAARDLDPGATAPTPAAPPAGASKLAAPASAHAPKASAPVVAQVPPAVAREPVPQSAAPKAPAAAGSSAGAIAAASAAAPAKPARSAIVLPRFVPDADHPFSPAALRERQKCARRLRLNAAHSRKQRGALRRAA
jgi:hypothetical protein